MKKLWKNRLYLFLLLFFSSDFFYSLTAWFEGYSLKIGYNFLLTPKVFLFSAVVDLLLFIYLTIHYGKSAH